MTNVYIVRKDAIWSLVVKYNGKILNSWQFDRLILAIDMASTLQMHIENIETLPLNQYSKGA